MKFADDLPSLATWMAATAALLLTLGALELTPDTWDAALAGKAAFVKFLAPW